jgi:hypothetical protein
MTGADAQFEAEYGESWDAERRALAGPLAVREARRRHAAREPYAVLLGTAGRPRVLLEVEGRKDEIAGWCFDGEVRRAWLFEFRVLGPDRMALLGMAEWQYADADRPEFDPTSPRCLTTFDGGGGPVTQPIGAPEAQFRTLESFERWAEPPAFAAWAPLAVFMLGLPPQRERHRVVGPADREYPTPRSAPEPRSRPEPAPAPATPTAFVPPGRYSQEPFWRGHAPEVVVETRPVGLLRMPTGHLVAAGPGPLDDDVEAFGVAVPRGHHPVTLVVSWFVDAPDTVMGAGCRIDVKDAPVVSWEQALCPGQDPATLCEGWYFGVRAEAGMLCFFDAEALPGLAGLTAARDDPRGVWGELRRTVERDGSAEMVDPATGTNVLAFPIGWGDEVYPVWIGRDAEGDVACVLADGLVLDDATYLGPVE